MDQLIKISKISIQHSLIYTAKFTEISSADYLKKKKLFPYTTTRSIIKFAIFFFQHVVVQNKNQKCIR